jgi:hypothetical protein
MLIVERRMLSEAAGTYSFFRPSDESEILCDGNYHSDHSDYIVKHPERFGLTAGDVEAASLDANNPDPYSTPEMQTMARLLALVLSKGWVRVNFYRGAWNFQALDLKTARRALAHYFENNLVQEATLDWGPDVAHPQGMTLYPADEVRRFIRTGRVPSR